MNLLYMDLLGTKKKWELGGRDAVESEFAAFRKAVALALHAVGVEDIADGGIEADSCAIVCRTELKAFRLGQSIFAALFGGNPQNSATRKWIRASIVSYDHGPIKNILPMEEPFSMIKLESYSASLLQGLSVERSGFKGMRILVEDSLITQQLRDSLKIPIGTRNLIPIKRLEHSDYRTTGFQDWLWMLEGEDYDRDQRKLQMATRLRWASKDPDEFLQAAATQLVFNECDAIRASLQPHHRI